MAITRSQQAKQMLQDGGMLVKPGFGGTRQGYRGEAAAASDRAGGRNAGRSDTGSPSGRGDGPASTGDSGDRREQRSVATTQGISPTTQSALGVDRRAVGQFSQYGRNLMNRNLRGPTVRERISKGLTNLRNRNIKKFIDRSIRKDLFRSGFVPNAFMGIKVPTTLGIASETGYSLFGPDVDLFDVDSKREIASTLTNTGGSLTKSQSKALESFGKNIANRDELLEKGMTQERFEELYPGPTIDDRDGPQDPCLGPNPPAYCFVGIRSAAPVVEEEPEYVNPLSKLTSRIAGTQFEAAGGGIASLEDMDREGFLLGGIAKGLKKAVRGIKKLAKSPIGKAALGFAAFQYGGGLGGIMDKFNKLSTLQKVGLGIGATSLAAGAMTPKEDKDKFDTDSYYASGQTGDVEPFTRIAGSKFDFYGGRMASADGGRIKYQEGSKEPVAKKTMPLLDMDGMEKDYREDGGFVPIGRMEKADDVPARLSKNEFVFTADAVRNAGDGDVDKGAEVMYNMMKNLESGGEVSEESQGLEGARKMFQTSQRLEEVL